MTHSGVYEWYEANVVPTLSTANPFVTGPIDAPIIANGESLYATTDVPLLNQFAYFYDNNPDELTSDYAATINWGDQTGKLTGTIVGTPNLGYYASGTHTYVSSGIYHYTVTIQNTGGSTATVTGTVNVSSG